MATAIGIQFFRSLCDLGHKQITQGKLKQAFSDDLFHQVFGWTREQLRGAGWPLDPSDIQKLSESEPGAARDIQVAIIHEMKAKWPISVNKSNVREQDQFFSEVAPLAFIFEATKKHRRDVASGRSTSGHSTSEGNPPSAAEDPVTFRLYSDTEDGNGHVRQHDTTTATQAKVRDNLEMLQEFEVWDVKAKKKLFHCFMVDVFNQQHPAPNDVHYDTILSLYHKFSKASGIDNDQVLFQYVDKQSRSWAVFDDISLRSVYRQFLLDACADPFFLLVDDGLDRQEPLKSPYGARRPPSSVRRTQPIRQKRAAPDEFSDRYSSDGGEIKQSSLEGTIDWSQH